MLQPAAVGAALAALHSQQRRLSGCSRRLPPNPPAPRPQVLHSALLAAARLELKAKRRELLAAMRSMPDYTMHLSWRVGSSVPGLGMLLRRYAPADTYTLWKVGRGG